MRRREDEDLALGSARFDVSEDLQTRHSGQAQIEDDHIRIAGCCLQQAIFAFSALDHLVVVGCKRCVQKAPDGQFIFDDHHSKLRFHL